MEKKTQKLERKRKRKNEVKHEGKGKRDTIK